MARNQSLAVLNPNLGLYLDRVPLAIPDQALRDCLNVRIKEGRIVRDNMGWGPFPETAAETLNLDGDPVLGIDNFFPRGGGQLLIFGTTRNLYRFLEDTSEVVYINPRYETGSVDATNASATVTGNGTAFGANAKEGDFIHIGAAGAVSPDDGWYEIAEVVSDTELTLVEPYAGATGSTVPYTVRQTFTADMRTPWQFETFTDAENVEGSDGDRWYATNGRDAVVAWDGSTSQVYRPDLGDVETCRFMTRFKNIMIYGAPVISGDSRSYSIRTSAIGQPENVVTLEAAELVVHDGVDPLLAAVPIGDNLAIYGERSITLAQFVGPPLLYIFRSVISGLGPLSTRSVADFGDFHEFLGPDAQYRFDGISVQEIGFQVWRDVIRRQSPNRLEMINGHFDEENGELIWIMPLTSDADPDEGPPERAYVEHYLELVGETDQSPITQREMPFTAMGFYSRETTTLWSDIQESWQEQNFRWSDRFFQGAFPFNLAGDAQGNIFILNTRDSKNGEPITSFARFGRRPLGSTRRKGTVLRIYPFADTRPSAGYPLTVRLWMTDTVAGSTSLAASLPFDLTASTSRHFVSPRRTARYAEVEFRTVGTGRGWELHGYDMDVVSAGER